MQCAHSSVLERARKASPAPAVSMSSVSIYLGEVLTSISLYFCRFPLSFNGKHINHEKYHEKISNRKKIKNTNFQKYRARHSCSWESSGMTCKHLQKRENLPKTTFFLVFPSIIKQKPLIWCQNLLGAADILTAVCTVDHSIFRIIKGSETSSVISILLLAKKLLCAKNYCAARQKKHCAARQSEHKI